MLGISLIMSPSLMHTPSEMYPSPEQVSHYEVANPLDTQSFLC